MRIRPRWVARTIAWLNGYFWLPCPACGAYFAGFESTPGSRSLPDPRDSRCGLMTCGCLEKPNENAISSPPGSQG